MKFETELVPWIDEVKNYLESGSQKIGEIKRILRKVDFSNLDYAAKARLTMMFDPNCTTTEEVFKRQIDLYFSLLESKTAPIKMPVFSDYIDWIYSQDIDKLTDVTFDIISSRLLKTTADNLSESINSFMSRLPYEFGEDIDTISNSRLGTLVNILKETGNSYSDMPIECKDFIERMYLACAVKSEIADKNKTQFRHLFGSEPKGYYSMFNKAYAGISAFGSWIDEPAKKITYKCMVDYANYQSKVIKSLRERCPLNYSTFESCANELKLPAFPSQNQTHSVDFKRFYLAEPREYKTYAKKLSKLFAMFVKAEVDDLEKKYYGKVVPQERIDRFAVTNDMKSKLTFKGNVVDEAFLNKYAMYLIDLVHLDQLTGQAARDIYPIRIKPANAARDEQITIGRYVPLANVQTATEKSTSENNNSKENSVTAQDIKKDYAEEKQETETPYVEGQVTLALEIEEQNLDDEFEPFSNFEFEDLELRIAENLCTEKDLPELYEIYNQLLANGVRNLQLENIIFDLEFAARESQGQEQEIIQD